MPTPNSADPKQTKAVANPDAIKWKKMRAPNPAATPRGTPTPAQA
jgi:hypothetical protein